MSQEFNPLPVDIPHAFRNNKKDKMLTKGADKSLARFENFIAVYAYFFRRYFLCAAEDVYSLPVDFTPRCKTSAFQLSF